MRNQERDLLIIVSVLFLFSCLFLTAGCTIKPDAPTVSPEELTANYLQKSYDLEEGVVCYGWNRQSGISCVKAQK